MSGYTARTGFRYQDLYLLFRILQDASTSLERVWQNGIGDTLDALDKIEVRYGIEASPRTDLQSGEAISEGPDWDVLVLTRGRFEFSEVKSGAITKDDRLAFWKRLRRELASPLWVGVEVVPILVVDPDNAGDLSKWDELAAAASQFTGSGPTAEAKINVLTVAQLLDEALRCLCQADTSGGKDDPPAPFSVALSALGRFEVHRHKAQQLDSNVYRLVELLFPGGLADTEQTLLLGWLNNRATVSSQDQRLFTIRELLGEIGILEHSASLAPGTLREWRDLWNDAPQGVIARTRLQLGEAGESVPAVRIQPAALNVLANGGNRSVIILGPGGAGKSTFLAQVAEVARRRGDVVMHCGADDVILEELEKIVKAFRFRAALAAIKNPGVQSCLFVDGLDEAEPALRKRWAQLLVRLTNLPNALLVASLREAVWNADGELKGQLGTWPCVTLALWPENLIHELLEPTPFRENLPPSVINLLRTPILLDLFWRTFVEAGAPDVSLAAKLRTRHNLLAAYWEQRLVRSPRYTSVRDLPLRLGELFSRIAAEIGPFLGIQLDSEVLQVLLSEGILVREGKLQPRLRFRHSLLQDFAFAQCCLATDSAAQLVHRWNSIRGGLRRYGVLRAIFEALSDPNAAQEYPHLEVGSVIQAIIRADPNLASQLAQILGTNEASAEVDPSTWPTDVQSLLPAGFAYELLSAARLARNRSWAFRVEHWPYDATWLREGFSFELLRYLWVLLEMLKSNSADDELREQCRGVSRKLRHISEIQRFASDFEKSERWLKIHAMLSVIPTLPDEATLSWVEREMSDPSWHTRSNVLEKLIFLVPVDAGRTSMLYRIAVGLAEENGLHKLIIPWQGPIFDHHAIEWSLAGEDGRRGLLKEYPQTFLPVAIDLAEALWRERDRELTTGVDDIVKQIVPSASMEEVALREQKEEENLGGLIDDGAEWGYWRSSRDLDARSRVLGAIHDCAKRCMASSLEDFCSSMFPILRSSRLCSIQSILLDVLLVSHEKPICANCILECILDQRLFYASGIEYWMEQGLVVCWPYADAPKRGKIFETIRVLLKTPVSEHNARNFLSRLAVADLPADLRKARPAEGDPAHQPYGRPREASITSLQGVPVAEDDERLIGRWPQDFDRELLLRFSRLTKEIASGTAQPEKIPELLNLAMEAARQLAAILKERRDLLEDSSHSWVWRGLADILKCFYKTYGKNKVPDEELVRNCADLAISQLRDIPSDLRGNIGAEGLINYIETSWTVSLSLADIVLIWPPVVDDHAIQEEFFRIVTKAFESGLPLVQFVCTTLISPWHWLRNPKRRQLHDRLVWQLPRHAGVLAYSLNRTAYYSDSDRERVFRVLLSRNDVEDPKQLAHWLGQHVGVGSVIVFPTGERSAVAGLAREIFENPANFPLLVDGANWHEFLRQFAFGMREQAMRLNANTVPAADYGRWALTTWRALRANRPSKSKSENALLVMLSWLERKERKQLEIAKLKSWWKGLQPLLNAVVTEGGRPDCFRLFFQLLDGEYNDLTPPEDLLQLAEIFAERIKNGANNGGMKLDEIDRENNDWHSWRECADFLSEAIDSLRRDGSLQTDLQRERAHRLLSQLASEPIRSSKAIEALHRLQND